MPTAPLDLAAQFYVQGLIFMLLPLTAWTILAGRHDAKAVALWCSGGLLSGLSFVFIGLRGQIPAWLSYEAATVAVYAGYILRGGALQHELQRPVRWITWCALGALAALGYHLARSAGREVLEVVGTSTRLVGAAWLAGLAFALARRERTRSASLLGAVFALAATASGLRLVAIAATWGSGQPPTALDYALINLAAMLTAIYGNLGYVGLVLERSRAREQQQTAALQQAHDRRIAAEQHALGLDALRAQRRDLLNEATPAMLHSIDMRGRLLAVSDTWLSRLGYTRAEVIGKSVTDFLTPASRDKASDLVMPAFFKTGRSDHITYQMVTKEGRLLDVSLSAVLVRDEAGQPARSLAVIEDVTEQLAREAELAREQALRRQLEQHAAELAARARERHEMIHVLAHEVRQPLNNASAAMQSAAAVLAQTREVAAAQRLGRAQAVLGEVLAGLDNTLAAAALLASSDAVPTEDVDIDAVLSIAMADLPLAERHRVQVQRLTTTRTAAMDSGLMRLAVRNLLANALGYSPAGSAVILRVLDWDEPLALVLEVVDFGAGIDAALMPRLFERGARGVHGADHPGSGLGLYIVRRVMELHGGQVAATRHAQGGMAMRLLLPQGLGD